MKRLSIAEHLRSREWARMQRAARVELGRARLGYDADLADQIRAPGYIQ